MPDEFLISDAEVYQFLLEDDGRFPNNNKLPLLFYRQALSQSESDLAAAFENLFEHNRWGGGWRSAIFSFHHYHSTAHEVLGVYSGSADLQFGGDEGEVLQVAPGDVVIIPAGVAHKSVRGGSDFSVVGAYPFGQRWDTCYGKPDERPQADRNIGKVPLPDADPVHGLAGPLRGLWREMHLYTF